MQPPAEFATFSHDLADQLGLVDGAFGALLFNLVEHLNAAVAVKEIASGRYAHVSPRMAALFGQPAPAAVGKSDAELFGADLAAPLRSADAVAGAQLTAHHGEHRIERDGMRREFHVMRMALPPVAGGVPFYLCCVWIELTEQHRRDAQFAGAMAQLEQQQVAGEAMRRELQDGGLRDTTTGLYQGAHFDDQLRREVDLSSREHREFALVSIQLDPLSAKARSLGSESRVRVLEALGRLLRGNTRAMDASSRIDEERFAILLSGVGLATAHARMEGLRRQCATQLVVLNGENVSFSVSMGVASFPHTAHTQEALMQAADAALAEAQRRGGNHVTLASIRFDAIPDASDSMF